MRSQASSSNYARFTDACSVPDHLRLSLRDLELDWRGRAWYANPEKCAAFWDEISILASSTLKEVTDGRAMGR